MYIFSFCLLAYTIPVIHSYTISISQYSNEQELPKNLTVGDGQSLFLFWKPSDKSLTKCTITTPQKVINLIKGSQGNFIVSKTLLFKNGYCCVTINNISFDKGNRHYLLQASDGGTFYNASTYVTVTGAPDLRNINLTVIEGSSPNFVCGNNEAIYCSVTHPRGEIETFGGACTVSINQATYFLHHGYWNCSFVLPNYVTSFNTSVYVTVVEDEHKEVFVKEFDNEIVFYCKAPEKYKLNKYCKIITPYGKELFFSRGSVIGRYTYYGDKPNYCGITIPKPLASEDVGPWGCQLVNSLSGTPNLYGGYLNIGSEKKVRSVQVDQKKMFRSGLSLNSPILRCHVPYTIEYCWFRSPNGTVFNIKDEYILEKLGYPLVKIRSLGFKFGDCSFQLSKLTNEEIKNNTGTWTCNIGIEKESVLEIRESIELLYSDVPILYYRKALSGELGSTVTLGCYTGAGVGIKYCRLIRPDGTGISVDPTKNNTDYSYHGRGFLYGDCGISIHNLKQEDVGSWICSVKLISSTTDSLEYSTQIIVLREKGSYLVVYLVVGVMSLLSLLGVTYFVTKKFEFNIHRRLHDDTDNLINSDEPLPTTLASSRRLDRPVKYVRRRSPRPPSTINQETVDTIPQIQTHIPASGSSYI